MAWKASNNVQNVTGTKPKYHLVSCQAAHRSTKRTEKILDLRLREETKMTSKQQTNVHCMLLWTSAKKHDFPSLTSHPLV